MLGTIELLLTAACLCRTEREGLAERACDSSSSDPQLSCWGVDVDTSSRGWGRLLAPD